MAYLGLAPVTNFLTTFSEKFSGTGSTSQFILSRAVSRSEDLEVFIGNTQVIPGNYTAVGTELTFNDPPSAGTDNITVIFRAGALQSVELGAAGFPGGSQSTPSVFYVDGVNTGMYWPSGTQIGFSTQGVRRVQIDTATSATSTTTGALQVDGGAGITGNLYVGGVTRFTDETQSGGTATGSALFSGGVGIAKNVNIGGDIQVTGDFTVAGTFTTTASDSLAISDPFLFLATNNTGDSIDTGFVSKYVDGLVTTRYTGFFRDVTDGVYKVFANLTVEPATTVTATDPSFELADFRARAIGASGTLQATSGAAASSTTTGALQVTGGVGITGTVYATGLDLSSGNIATTGFIGNVAGLSAQGQIETSSTLLVGNTATFNTANVATAIINGAGNGFGNIGQSGVSFNTAFVKATSAQYADVAEKYLADAAYTPGTVLHFGGDYEVSQCNQDMCSRVAGVVSTNPAYIMNDGIQGQHVVSLALLGRVPCKIEGAVTKGDMMVSAGNGRARAEANPKLGAVIGKALESWTPFVDENSGKLIEHATIEVVVGRN
jgi:hypothetical protein